MTITTQRLLTELGRRAWSGFNKDDMVFGSEDAQTALAELNAANRYLMSLEDFPFHKKTEEIITVKNTADYAMVNGQISQIVNQEDFSVLTEIINPDRLAKKQGKPYGFYVTCSNPDSSITFYPVPDGVYKFEVVYDSLKFILDKKGNELDEFTNADDVLNLPDYLEYLYMDCLILRTICTNNKDQEDENYVPSLNEFKQAWRNFLRKARPSKREQRIII